METHKLLQEMDYLLLKMDIAQSKIQLNLLELEKMKKDLKKNEKK